MTFEEFFGHLWKDNEGEPLKPFPWQSALARWVKEKKAWPDTIEVPTSAGKTALIDIAVYALAERWPVGATRIFFVVDRRVVVDEARERAKAIQRRIIDCPELKALRESLAVRAGSDQPIHVSTMRGGMPLETVWAKSPIQPTICLSTVDQLGSRLLFRGYGVSAKMAPIHAGLVATDSLIVLDEAHLSEPFRQTLSLLKRFRSSEWCDEMIGQGMHVTYMSATLPKPAANNREVHFQFKESYHEGEEPSAILAQRLNAAKLANLVPVGDKNSALWKRPPKSAEAELRRWKKRESERRKVVEEKCAELARECLTLEYSPKVIAVILNRVNSARSVFARLQKWNAENGGKSAVILLTGRSRPLDRDRLISQFWDRIRAGRVRNAHGRPLLVVATQCIEAGANLDFDALVTELASLDALRQRFGRLNRLGELNASQAWVVARVDHIQNGDDAIYGLAAKETFKFLEQVNRDSGKRRKNAISSQSINFGINCLAKKLPADLAPYLTPRKNAPTLMPAHLDYFAQTNPCPTPDPDAAIFLHGPNTEPAEVRIVWRADLPQNIEGWAGIISLLPPTSAEALSLPIYAVTKWLHAGGETDLTDVEGVPEPEEHSKSANGLRQPALIWRGKKKKPVPITSAADTKHLKPGDTLVIQASAGGLDEFGWNPDSSEAVRDVADIALSQQRGRATLRLHPAVVSSWLESVADTNQEQRDDLIRMMRRLHQSADDDLVTEATSSEIPIILQFVADAEWLRPEICEIGKKAGLGRKVYPDGSGWICSGRKDPSNFPIFLWEEDDASTLEDARRLDGHIEDVAQVLESWLPHLQLPGRIRQALLTFPSLHDIGKADPRFQDFLYGGDLESLGESLRAKSEDENLTKEEFDERWVACGLPSGWRHELCSLDIVKQNPQLLNSLDEDQKALLKHSIGSHHGFGRILPPIIENAGAPEINQRLNDVDCQLTARYDWHRLDSGWIDQFAKLQLRFGWHGLAYLEAIVRLADHVASAKLD